MVCGEGVDGVDGYLALLSPTPRKLSIAPAPTNLPIGTPPQRTPYTLTPSTYNAESLGLC